MTYNPYNPDVVYLTAAEYAALPPSDDWTGPAYRIVDEDLPVVRSYTREEIAEWSRTPEWREAAADAAEDARKATRFRAYRLDDTDDDSDCL